MKTKILIPFFAFFLCTCTLFAQPKSFNVGIDFIPNYSFSLGEDQNVYIDDYYYGYNSGSNSRKKKPSIAFGVVLSYQLSNKWSFESGLKYVNRGHNGTGNNYNYPGRYNQPVILSRYAQYTRSIGLEGPFIFAQTMRNQCASVRMQTGGISCWLRLAPTAMHKL